MLIRYSTILIWLAILVLIIFIVISAALGQMPDPVKTPGAVRDLTKAQICSTKWMRGRKVITEASERKVTAAMKRQVFRSYGIECRPITSKAKGLPRCANWEIDHSVPRSLGGADDVKNLFPQPFKGRWNAHRKDVLERRLQREVCAGLVDLKDAQREIAREWPALYIRYYGEPK